MSDDVRDEPLPVSSNASEIASSVDGPLRAGVFGRRVVLQSLATGVGAAVLAAPASAHVHQAPAGATPKPATAARTGAAAALVFFDKHAFDTLAILAEQIVPGSRAAKVPEFLDRLLAVEALDTQKRFVQSIGAFERQAREAHGKPWKSLTASEATALLTRMSEAKGGDASRAAFDTLKSGISETYYATEAGLKDLGWNRSVMFASPVACG